MNEPILPLTPGDVGSVRLTWLSSYDKEGLRRFLTTAPATSYWVPDTGEYILAGWWRGRSEVAHILEVTSRRNRERLVEKVTRDAERRDARAIVLSVSEAWREGRWFRQNGFSELDSIVTMVLQPVRQPELIETSLEVCPYDPAEAEMLQSVDRTSFPWLWWNDPHDFDQYRLRDDVRVWTGWETSDGERRMVSYASATLRPGRGHLDRIAVSRNWQGKGLGRAMLLAVLGELAKAGAREVALTTQIGNQISQTLYRSVGFRRTTEIEPIVGRWLNGGAPE